jgi:segregation and condensation protein B
MNELMVQIETLLFVETRGISIKLLAKTLGCSIDEATQALEALRQVRNTDKSGIHVLVHADRAELVSNPANAEIANRLLKEEMSGELTKPQLETLTVVAYRGPLTRLEIEQVRGVNCQIILRNLQMRGLVEELDGELVPLYQVTNEFLKTLGVTSLQDLPDYEVFHADERITALLAQTPQA